MGDEFPLHASTKRQQESGLYFSRGGVGDEEMEVESGEAEHKHPPHYTSTGGLPVKKD